MKKLIFRESGFTLIEVVIVLVISGFLLILAGRGVTTVIKGYMSAKKNSETAYKGQIAMMRMSKELRRLSSVAAGQGSSTAIVYGNYKNGTLETHKFSWSGVSGDPLLYDDFSNDGSILVDQVDNFSLAYYDSYNDAAPKAVFSGTTKLIGVTLALIGADNIPFVYTGKITPRNLP
jgi:prepilin-type N-terminal cleavage/methylation domain-containing protein